MFQSTLPRGERPAASGLLPGCREFQSTLPRGERPALRELWFTENGFSIHAPTGGATRHPGIYARLATVSIHAPTGGATTITICQCCQLWFQSTLPRGERPKVRTGAKECRSFNPRSHGGSDVRSLACPQHPYHCFNPRSHGGSDRMIFVYHCRAMFQSTLPRGERHNY